MENETTIGRPSGYSIDIAEEICERMANGKGLREICRADDMPDRTTVLRWLEKQADFRVQYARAREALMDFYQEEILRIALQRFQLRIRLSDDIRLRLYAGLQKGAQADQLEHLDALKAFQEDDHVAVGHFYGLMHLGQRSEFVEVSGRRILYSRIKLRDHSQNLLVALQTVH